MRSSRSCLSPIPESFSPTTTPHPPNPKNMKKKTITMMVWVLGLSLSFLQKLFVLPLWFVLLRWCFILISSLHRRWSGLWIIFHSVGLLTVGVFCLHVFPFLLFLVLQCIKMDGMLSGVSRRSCLRAPGVLVTRICILKTITVDSIANCLFICIVPRYSRLSNVFQGCPQGCPGGGVEWPWKSTGHGYIFDTQQVKSMVNW